MVEREEDGEKEGKEGTRSGSEVGEMGERDGADKKGRSWTAYGKRRNRC